MTRELAFVGDVHGNLRALRGLWDVLRRNPSTHVVFLGDYINKGTDSKDVLELLIAISTAGQATLLAGNHETGLVDALGRRDLSGFLKMGGAATIRSYAAGRRVRPDVLADFASMLPEGHLDAVRRMPTSFETDELIAQHISKATSGKFQISAHVPVGDLPRIGHRSAQLDTGCGTASGRLTAMYWPSLQFVQVDSAGCVVS